MTWLKTYNTSAGFTQSGRVNLESVGWFEVATPPGGVFGVYALAGVGASSSQKLVTPGYPYATAADAVAAIDDIILNGS